MGASTVLCTVRCTALCSKLMCLVWCSAVRTIHHRMNPMQDLEKELRAACETFILEALLMYTLRHLVLHLAEVPDAITLHE